MEENPFALIKALERDLERVKRSVLTQPPAGTPNGSQISSDTTQTGGVKWVGPVAHTLAQATGYQGAGAGVAEYFLPTRGAWVSGSNQADAMMVYLDPGDYGPTPQIRIRCGIGTNDAAPYASGTNLTIELVRATAALGGASGSIDWNWSGEVVVATATVARTSITANAELSATSSWVSFSTAGHYLIRVTPPATQAANSTIQIGVLIQAKLV
jgi:hypothetical protein